MVGVDWKYKFTNKISPLDTKIYREKGIKQTLLKRFITMVYLEGCENTFAKYNYPD